jgi:Domain of unknown function (DUF4105)
MEKNNFDRTAKINGQFRFKLIFIVRILFKYICSSLVWLIVLLLQFWASGVIYFCSFPNNSTHRGIIAIIYLLVFLIFVFSQKGKTRALLKSLIGFLIIFLWFSSIRVNPNAIYPEHLKAPYAEINDNDVTIHNVRYNRYRTKEDFDVYYETRTYDISKLKTLDIFVNYWGMDAIAHAFVSFGFGDGRYLPISIEIRPEVGEAYGMLDGLFKQYELLYLWADERDVVLTRTNIRKQDAYLYRVNMKPESIRKLFVSMLKRTNNLYKKPEFYNTLLESCTNTIGDHVINEGLVDIPFWKRRFLSGDVDKRMYNMGLLDTKVPFDVLRKKSKINERALDAGNVSDFSEKIRAHLN